MRPAPDRKRSPGFSLVELALALGIASFALIALLGLITVGYQTGGDAKEETLIAGMAQYVYGELKEQPFDTLATQTFYFDAQGNPLPGNTDAVYRCVTQIRAVDELPGVQTNLIGARLVFEWPPSAATPQRMIFQTSIAR